MIVWLASYPRSGNTLLRILLQRAFGLSTWSLYNDEGDIAKDQAFTELVGHRSHDGDVKKLMEGARASDEPYLIKTHDGPGDNEKAIYVIREGRASVVSFYHYLKDHSPLDYEMDDVIAGAVPFGSWGDHVKSWDPINRANTLFLKFEDLRENPEPAIEKISDFLGMPLVGSGGVSFEELQKVAPNFFRSGNNNKNNAEMSADQTALFNSLHAAVAQEYGYEAGEGADVKTISTKLVEQSSRFWASKKTERRNLLTERRLAQLDRLTTSVAEMRKQQMDMDGAYQSEKERRLAIERLIAREREKLKAQSEELKVLRENLAHRRKRNAGLEAELAAAKGMLVKERNSVQAKLEAEIVAARERLEVERNTTELISQRHRESRQEIASLSREQSELSVQLTRARNQLAFLESILAPRLKSIMTLRPLRYVIKERNRLKREGGVEELPQIAISEPVENDKQTKSAFTPTFPSGQTIWPGFGIAVFGFTRPDCIRNTLESLARQDAIHVTHVFLDGDQGRPDVRRKIDEVHEIASAYPVKEIHRQRSGFGFRKMMLIAGKYMQANYERMLFLEDDCFPVDGAIAEFNRELDAVEDDTGIFSVYGHPFLVEGEEAIFPRFQGWGWATTRAKLAPIWESLEKCYLMSEPEYLDYVRQNLSPEIERRIDVTPGRQPTSTLNKFFAWDETVCLLTALKGQQHKRADRRVIYNCGAGLESSHFKNLIEFRRPPFNMIGADEVWDHFQS